MSKVFDNSSLGTAYSKLAAKLSDPFSLFFAEAFELSREVARKNGQNILVIRKKTELDSNPYIGYLSVETIRQNRDKNKIDRCLASLVDKYSCPKNVLVLISSKDISSMFAVTCDRKEMTYQLVWQTK